MPSFVERLRVGFAAFKEAFLTAPIQDAVNWDAQDARMLRYAVLWSWYEQTSYRDVHNWATAYRKQYALYKYIRPIYNPAYRLGEFWKAHLYGGLLDPEVGETGAIPIITDNEALRPAIAELWKWSRWDTRKDVLTAKGAILGDILIQVVDDVRHERVYLELVHPGLFDSIDKDPFGNVKGYKIAETRPDPRGRGGSVTYVEAVSRKGDSVVYETFLNGEPYAWPENTDRLGVAVSSWQEPYGFVPLVAIQHSDVGLNWGWSELHPIRGKVHEADDIASQVSDQVRKTIDPVWLMKGIKRPSGGVITLSGANAATASTGASDTDRPAPGREEIQALWNAPVDGDAQAMVPKLDLENVLLHLSGIVSEIERDMPELSPDIHTASGDASGRALRVARQPVVSKVLQRRVNYDAGLVAAQQMGLAIGGWRGYNGYEGFDLNSYAQGNLEHHIGARAVFEEDPLDAIEISAAFWGAAKAARETGISLVSYLKDAGWSKDRIAEMEIDDGQASRDGGDS